MSKRHKSLSLWRTHRGPIDIVVMDIKKVTENCNILLKFNKKLFVYCQNLLKTVVLAISGENIASLTRTTILQSHISRMSIVLNTGPRIN